MSAQVGLDVVCFDFRSAYPVSSETHCFAHDVVLYPYEYRMHLIGTRVRADQVYFRAPPTLARCFVRPISLTFGALDAMRVVKYVTHELLLLYQ